MKKAILLLLLIVPAANGYKPTKYCSYIGTNCTCLLQHADWEFCSTGLVPSCCKAAEKNSKITMCGCCPSGRLINVIERGTYLHATPSEVEYRQ